MFGRPPRWHRACRAIRSGRNARHPGARGDRLTSGMAMRLFADEEARAPATTRDAWGATCDALLAGLAHAMSNRVASLTAVLSLAQDGAQAAGLSLESEVARLNAMLRLLRALASRTAGRAVALDAIGLLETAAELHATHGALRDVAILVEREESVPPVVAPEGALTRALLLAFTAARAAAAASGRSSVRARCRHERDRVLFEIVPTGPASDKAPPPAMHESPALASAEGRAAEELLRPAGGEVREASEGRILVSVPAVRASADRR